MRQRAIRRIPIVFALALASAITAVAQSSTPLETFKLPISSASASDNWQAALQVRSAKGKLIVVTVDQPNRRQSCHVQSFTPVQLVCSRAKGRRRTYLSQQVAALILPGDDGIKPWLLLLGNGELGAAIWGTVVLAVACPACAVATGFAAFYLAFGTWVARFWDDQPPDRLLYLAAGQHLSRKFAQLGLDSRRCSFRQIDNPRNVGFADFYGNAETVRHLRESIRVELFPHSLILAGPKGAGKYTLAPMLARTAARPSVSRLDQLFRP